MNNKSLLKGRFMGEICLKRPKIGKIRQIVRPYNTARVVQYDEIRVNTIRRIIRIRHMTHPWRIHT